jgi:ABC-type branched-subunit amino acid transport system ATPase component
MVAMGRALMAKPKLLLMDEPSMGGATLSNVRKEKQRMTTALARSSSCD